MNLEERTERNRQMEAVMRHLESSENALDQRKVNDLRKLVQLSKGQWDGRFDLRGFGRNRQGFLVPVCLLRAKSLLWQEHRTNDDKPVIADAWSFALLVPQRYPYSLPSVHFFGSVPWSPHVVHAMASPMCDGLSPELREHLKQGHGYCCYTRAAQWSPDARTHNLAVVVWQVSRILTFTKWWGEAHCLNSGARDEALRLQKEGRLPLGDPLPAPYDEESQSPDEDGLVEWDEGGTP